MESLLSTAECRKSTKNSIQVSRLGPLRAPKKQKNHQDFDADGPAASKDTFFFDFGDFSIAGAHPALRFFSPPVKETWQPVLRVYTSQNKPN